MRPLNRCAITALIPIIGLSSSAVASSHSDAPLIKQDPQANLTDVYAFMGTRYNDAGAEVLNIVANVRPFSEPGDGPHYERFSDDALYSLHVTDPATGEPLFRYDFKFSAVDQGLKNPDTILSYGLGTGVGAIGTIGDANQNFTQTYTVTKVLADGTSTLLGDGTVGLPNPGSRVTPMYNDADGRAVSGAATLAELDEYTTQAIGALPTGEVVFAGPRDDSFYADIPAVMDLLDARILAGDGNGVDGFKGFNVLTFAIQIPLADLTAMPFSSVFFGDQSGVGVYASVSRPAVRLLNSSGERESYGDWIQVNRLGNPLFNEGLVALRDKDNYNASSPVDDAAFETYASNSELATLINFVVGTEFATSDRADLVGIFIPDVLRVNTTTGPVTLFGEPGFDRLGFIGGDTTAGVSSGWPNGRRLGDDVVDIALTAIASGPTYDPISVLGDNVNGNDIAFNQVFPYAATPHAGTFNRKDPAGVFGDLDGDGQVAFSDLLLLLSNWSR